MSKIYQLIEEQINNIFRINMEESNGQLRLPGWIPGPQFVRPLIQFVSAIIFIAIVLYFGVRLWNFGIQPVLPGIVAPIQPGQPGQNSTPETQLLLTLLAFLMFF